MSLNSLPEYFSVDTEKSFKLFILNKIDKRVQYLISISTVFAVSAICIVLFNYIGVAVVAFILLLTLTIIAMLFDILPVLLTALLSALAWDYFFLAPRFNWSIGSPEDRIMLSTFFIIGSVNAVLTYKIRKIEKIARQKEEKAQLIKLYNTLLSSLSHELRTPIATIIGATDGLLTEPSNLSPNDKHNLLAEISTASLRLNQQVENLLNMSRLESGFILPKKDWCDVKELVYAVISRLDENLKHHQVNIFINENLPLFKLDYVLMEQVLYNLIYNAAQYTPEDSVIDISADCINEQLIITVKDNGGGFPEDEIEKVFEKFYRLTNTKTGGTGLGLSIVKGFIEAHNGIVELKNRPQGGAVFSIKLPAEKILLKPTEK